MLQETVHVRMYERITKYGKKNLQTVYHTGNFQGE
jgi:hypothetical protein